MEPEKVKTEDKMIVILADRLAIGFSFYELQFKVVILSLILVFYSLKCWQIKPLSVRYGLGISDHDTEGRLVTAEFDTFYLICGYIPNSGDGLKRLVLRSITFLLYF